MTTVQLDVLPNGSVTGFSAYGHADYGEEGVDIVCAAISALTLTAAQSLREVAQLDIGMELDGETGDLSVILEKKLKKSERNKADIILKSMRLGLQSIADEYPDHLTIVERRCK